MRQRSKSGSSAGLPRRVVTILAHLAASAGIPGCWGTGRIDIFTCEDPCGNGQPGTSCEHPCGECRGECVPIPPGDFDGPLRLWVGPELEAPGCPDRAPVQSYEGHADLDVSFECPACACTAPTCVLPSGLTASPETCMQGSGGTQTPFEAPVPWSGACTSPTTLPSDQVSSVQIAPTTVRPCEPIAPPAPQSGDDLFSPWKTYARACEGEVFYGRCRDPGLTCRPTAQAPPPGFRQCIVYLRDGDPECPAEYPDELTFYGGYEDTRSCTACACATTEEAVCSTWLSIYQDADCTVGLNSAVVVDGAICVDLADGMALGSMEASWIENVPGSCVASGGVPTGEATPRDRRTFCCRAPPG